MKSAARKRILRIAALLLLGAILNIPVAWGLVLWASLSNSPVVMASRSFPPGGWHQAWSVSRRQSWCAVRLIAMPRKAADHAPDTTIPDLYPGWSGWPKTLDRMSKDSVAQQKASTSSAQMVFVNVQMIDARGWPMLAMQSRWIPDLSRATPGKAAWWGAIPIDPEQPDPPRGRILDYQRALPLIPIWPGFAINTIFYAAILWLLFAAPGFVSRRIRARRGLCPACAYPIGASDVCTECGAVLPLSQGEGRGEGEAHNSKDAPTS